MRSSAYSILGTIQYDQEKYVDAEGYFRKSIDAYPAQPDPVVVLRLALALDKQGKYPDALTQANKAVDLTQEGTNAGTTARHERDRLMQLTGATIPAVSTPAPAAKPPDSAAPNTTLLLTRWEFTVGGGEAEFESVRGSPRESVVLTGVRSACSSDMKPRDISELERALGYQFSKPELLEQALDPQLASS